MGLFRYAFTLFAACSENEYKCTSNDVCVPKEVLCDSTDNCLGGEDEDEEHCTGEL